MPSIVFHLVEELSSTNNRANTRTQSELCASHEMQPQKHERTERFHSEVPQGRTESIACLSESVVFAGDLFFKSVESVRFNRVLVRRDRCTCRS